MIVRMRKMMAKPGAEATCVRLAESSSQFSFFLFLTPTPMKAHALERAKADNHFRFFFLYLFVFITGARKLLVILRTLERYR